MNDFFEKLPGYYTALIPSHCGARPLMRLSAFGIYYYDAVPTEQGITVKLSLFSCTRALAVAKSEGFELVLTSGVGLPFLFHRYRRRYGAYIGAAAACLIMFISQLFVWNVDINGNKMLSDNEMIDIAAQCGIYVGAFIPDIRVLKCESDILLLEDDISSVSVNLKGTHAEIELIERVHAPEIAETDGVCDITAADNGVVVRVEAARGAPCIKAGDRVTKGQILISGDVTTKEGYHYYCHASGNVYAETEYDFTAEAKLAVTRKCYTGKTSHRTVLTFLGKQIDLFEDAGFDFEYADCRSEAKEIKLFWLSTAFYKTDLYYDEFIYETFQTDASSAKSRCLLLLKQHIDAVEGELVDYYYEIKRNKKGDAYIINAHITVIKNIACETEKVQSPSVSPSESSDRT